MEWALNDRIISCDIDQFLKSTTFTVIEERGPRLRDTVCIYVRSLFNNDNRFIIKELLNVQQLQIIQASPNSERSVYLFKHNFSVGTSMEHRFYVYRRLPRKV